MVIVHKTCIPSFLIAIKLNTGGNGNSQESTGKSCVGSKAFKLMTMYVFLGGGHFSALESVQLGPATQSPILFAGYYGFYQSFAQSHTAQKYFKSPLSL